VICGVLGSVFNQAIDVVEVVGQLAFSTIEGFLSGSPERANGRASSSRLIALYQSCEPLPRCVYLFSQAWRAPWHSVALVAARGVVVGDVFVEHVP
jgi:hypothetical protein